MSESVLESPQVREAGPPFDATDADIILCSIDGVYFRTYKSYLTRALHGFEDLLVRFPTSQLGREELRY